MAAALAGAGANRRFALGQNHDINVTPFVDVMLVLLIIFMVTAPLATTSIRVDLPPVIGQHDPSRPVNVSITEDGHVFVSGPRGELPVTLSDLAGGIASVLGAQPSPDLKVFVRADKHVRYGAFMSVMNRLQDDGFYKVGLVGEDRG
ncbi:MAG TPA: biopolymer transporter ExbD [Caulobacteraceae bacterium]|jgi:biopolymer transport protein ExbD|nr:biopolymer transporter ExbD [Caulobacteraceae bacterium]